MLTTSQCIQFLNFCGAPKGQTQIPLVAGAAGTGAAGAIACRGSATAAAAAARSAAAGPSQACWLRRECRLIICTRAHRVLPARRIQVDQDEGVVLADLRIRPLDRRRLVRLDREEVLAVGDVLAQAIGRQVGHL